MGEGVLSTKCNAVTFLAVIAETPAPVWLGGQGDDGGCKLTGTMTISGHSVLIEVCHVSLTVSLGALDVLQGSWLVSSLPGLTAICMQFYYCKIAI